MWTQICERLSATLGNNYTYQHHKSVAGGCINRSYRLETNRGCFFVKTNSAKSLDLFKAETKGLEAIRNSKSVRCPHFLYYGIVKGNSVLVLEYISMKKGNDYGMQLLGQQLALMHQTTQDYFGLAIDNHIGETPQPNTPDNNWVTFFKKHRLSHQFNLCQRKGLAIQGTQKLIENLEYFFADYTPAPSLLHGDLWGGNIGFDSDGSPVIFDPACYFGDREADLAFTEMFGGFTRAFYESYSKDYPLDSGYVVRKRIYNLYHELNHYYLFGGGYGIQAQETIHFLLKQI